MTGRPTLNSRVLPDMKAMLMARRWHYALVALWLAGASIVQAQEVTESLTFSQARTAMLSGSHGLRSASLSTQAADASAEAQSALWQPVVTLEAHQLRYQQSARVSLDGLKDDLAGIGSGLDGPVGDVIGNLSHRLPDELRYTSRHDVFRSTVDVLMPLYTGGAITAAQEAARSAADLARAGEHVMRESLQFSLVGTYFGQVSAAERYRVTQANLDGFERHLRDAEMLEREGVIPHARTLEVRVARDSAIRANERARNDLLTARDELSSLLGFEAPLEALSPLFVNRQDIESLDWYLDVALEQQPQLKQADAGYDVAESEVDLVNAERLPKVYALGSYTLAQDDDFGVHVQPDWVIGVGISYTLNSNVNRNSAVRAASFRREAADQAREQVRSDVRSAVTRGWNTLQTARTQYLTLQSSMAAAEENLRVQEIAFREGEATAATVIDARNALANVQLQRTLAAYEYDLSLAALLTASGQGERFQEFLQRADAEVVL